MSPDELQRCSCIFSPVGRCADGRGNDDRSSWKQEYASIGRGPSRRTARCLSDLPLDTPKTFTPAGKSPPPPPPCQSAKRAKHGHCVNVQTVAFLVGSAIAFLLSQGHVPRTALPTFAYC